MTTAQLTLTILSDWHCGTGQGTGPDLDAQVIRTPGGLPFVPGRTLKGLLRDAVESAERAGAYSDVEAFRGVEHYFGTNPVLGDGARDDDPRAYQRRFTGQEGSLLVGSAMLGQSLQEATAWEAWAVAHAADVGSLFRSFSSTRVDESGVAASRSLRAVEVAVPMTLIAQLACEEADSSWQSVLDAALPFIDGIGSQRTRGFGQCFARVGPLVESPVQGLLPEVGNAGSAAQEVLAVRYHLVTDVAVSESNATVGGHQSLPFLRGSALMGAIARILYRNDEAWTRAHDWDLFHSGAVRFSDATLDGRWPSPLALHVRKGDRANGAFLPVRNGATEARRPEQENQIRDQWVGPDGGFARPVHRHTMRTAIDPTKGRVRDGYLFELDALGRGQDFLGTIVIGVPNGALGTEIAAHIRRALTEPLRVGRSSRQELGHVKATLDVATAAEPKLCMAPADSKRVVIWCLSDVALADLGGAPSLTPTPAHFGLPPHGCWNEGRSFVSVRRWSPFRNRKSTQSPLARPFAVRNADERAVLAGGSVITFDFAPGLSEAEFARAREAVRRGVGMYRSEGLGCVALEPEILAGTLPAAPAASSYARDPVARESVHAWLHNQVQQAGGTVSDESGALASWIDERVEERHAGGESWSLVATWLKQLLRAERLSPAQWGELRDCVRAAEPGRLAAAIKGLVEAKPTTETRNAVYREEAAGPSRGGVGVRGQVWARSVVRPGKSYHEWMVEIVEGDRGEATLRPALLMLCSEAVRAQRGRREEEAR